MKKKVKINKLVIKDYEKLVAEISEINGMLYYQNSIIEKYLKSMKAEDIKRISKFFLGSHFNYRSPIDGRFIWGDFYTITSKNYTDQTKLLNRKANNFLYYFGL